MTTTHQIRKTTRSTGRQVWVAAESAGGQFFTSKREHAECFTTQEAAEERKAAFLKTDGNGWSLVPKGQYLTIVEVTR